MPTYSYAGQLVNISGENFYYTDQGNVAKNYVHYDGKKTNDYRNVKFDFSQDYRYFFMDSNKYYPELAEMGWCYLI